MRSGRHCQDEGKMCSNEGIHRQVEPTCKTKNSYPCIPGVSSQIPQIFARENPKLMFEVVMTQMNIMNLQQ